MAKRLGFGPLMFETDEEYCNLVLKNWNISFQEFKKRGILSVPFTYRKYEKDGFNTPSGKVELYSQKLKDLGFDPLPSYREPTESPVSTPALLEDYPLIITTGVGSRLSAFRVPQLSH
jgi:anaerobic selenocysteine-containing dehydrogenase